MRVSTVFLVYAAATLAGCFGGDATLGTEEATMRAADYSHLGAPLAEVVDGNGTRSFLWDAVAPPGASVALVGPPPGLPVEAFEFEVDGSVGYVEAQVFTTAPDIKLVVLIRDDQGRPACGTMTTSREERTCTAPVPVESDVVTYTATVSSYGADKLPSDIALWLAPDAHQGGTPFTLGITLHPPGHMTWGDVTEHLDPSFAFRNADTGIDGAGEPTLGVDADGSVFAIHGTAYMRSDDDGGTWVDVAPAWDGLSFDPMSYVDPWTGRVFTNHLYIACSQLSWSDDKGETWLLDPAACGMPYDDHQKVAVGGHFLPSPVFDGIVYYSFNSFFEGLWVSRSLDGGMTWTTSLAVSDELTDWYAYRTGGPVVADREGNVYIGSYLVKGGFGVVVSNDYGVTWTPVLAGDKSGEMQGIDPGVAVDAAGNVYGAYWGPEGVRVVASTDRGHTWSDSVVVSPPGLKSYVLADATAGDEGRVAVAYLATADSEGGPNYVDGWARWHLYLSMTEDALAKDPVWVTARVTPEDDPVQIGTICTGGIGCFGGNRNLLDFIDIQPGPDGRVYIAYTDGCWDDCSELPQESRSERGIVAVQDEGPRLFADKAPWA